MNYKKLYNHIVYAQNITHRIGYTEKHHIKPRSLGGTDEQDNLVKLTAREHFICHYLLAKIYPKNSIEWYKMNHAFMMMKCESSYQERYFNSRLYEALRINFSEVMSASQQGKNNSQYGKIWICNLELTQSKIINKNDPIPTGWIKGRNRWITNKRRDARKLKKLALANKEKEIQKQKKEMAEKYWNLFLTSNYPSINVFHANSDFKYSRITMIKMFKRFIPEYKNMCSQGAMPNKHKNNLPL